MSSGPISAPQKVGACPSVLLNPGCREECLTDVDCAAFSKCCKASCGTKSQAPAYIGWRRSAENGSMYHHPYNAHQTENSVKCNAVLVRGQLWSRGNWDENH
ncbi:WAP-type 'four-disulfide core [Ancylostoma duodenale]|uniref:WAP-type 'four-disulfide core n=1 Tax=Ancylostoma duodenale TaxID=51022 RepID=A0A0C2CNV0_9BILA|nr:WAP-type 'four-disulfide core [Ancylostoma duodenale]